MNATTKTALAFLFTLTVIHFVVLIGAVLTGMPIGNWMGAYGAMDGRNWMWTPVFFWAWIPTTMMLALGGLIAWATFKYPRKKQLGFTSLDDSTVAQSADLHTLPQSPAQDNRRSVRSSRTGS